MDGINYVCPESWIGLEVHWLDVLSVVLASSRVFFFDMEEYFCDGKLDERYIGVTILDVFVEDTDATMSNECWLIFVCKISNGPSL